MTMTRDRNKFIYPQINYVTHLSQLSHDELIKLVNEKVEEAVIEYVFRSAYGEKGMNTVSMTDAILAVMKQLKTQPNHPVLNYIMGLDKYIDDKEPEAIPFFLKALKAEKGIEYVGQGASLLVATTYYREKNRDFIKATARIAQAFTLGAETAQRHFYCSIWLKLPQNKLIISNGETYDGVVSALELCGFLTIILAGKKLNNLGYSDWLKSWSQKDFKDQIEDLNDNIKNIEIDLNDSNSLLYKFLVRAIDASSATFYSYFNYCAQEQIVSRENYIQILEIFNQHAKDQSLKDKANYDLFIYYLNQNDLSKADSYLCKISNGFNQFKVSDLQNLNIELQDFISYQIFKQLLNLRYFSQALMLLTNVQGSTSYDKSVFDFFDEFDKLEETNFDRFKLRLAIASKIIQSEKNTDNQALWNQAFAEYELLSEPYIKCRYAVLSIISMFKQYLKERDELVKKNPARYFFDELFTENGYKRTQFVDLMKGLQNNHILNISKVYAKNDYIKFLKEILQLLIINKERFPGKKMNKVFDEAEQIVKEVLYEFAHPSIKITELVENKDVEKSIPVNIQPVQEATNVMPTISNHEEMNLYPSMVYNPQNHDYDFFTKALPDYNIPQMIPLPIAENFLPSAPLNDLSPQIQPDSVETNNCSNDLIDLDTIIEVPLPHEPSDGPSALTLPDVPLDNPWLAFFPAVPTVDPMTHKQLNAEEKIRLSN